MSLGSDHAFSDERHADRQAEDLAGRHGDARIARDRGWRRARAAEVVPVHEIRRPRRPAGRRHERVEPLLLHHQIDALRARQRAALRQRLR